MPLTYNYSFSSTIDASFQGVVETLGAINQGAAWGQQYGAEQVIECAVNEHKVATEAMVLVSRLGQSTRIKIVGIVNESRLSASLEPEVASQLEDYTTAFFDEVERRAQRLDALAKEARGVGLES